MTTAIAPEPAPITFEDGALSPHYPAKMRDWTPEQRSRAAKWGWRNRKDERLHVIRRTNLLLATGNPRVLRLLACERAETTLPIWEARFPGDVRLLALLQVARRYANGEASEAERLAASRLAVEVCRAIEPPEGLLRRFDPAYAMTNAVGFCLWRAAGQALYHAGWWTAEAHREERIYDLAGAQRFLAELEARLGAAEKDA
ncbi:MAG TPA: Imm5 family immunity protein [Chloroflexota bacterium]|nr:Imm5 family immunity protein [Chloroflexota bacterium]